MSQIVLRPLSLKEANTAVARWHRHHQPTRGHKFSVGAFIDGEMVGACIVGRPVAPSLDDGTTWEVTRLAIVEGAPKNVGSRLLGACWRAAKALGVVRLVSYTREDEHGGTYAASGWRATVTTPGRGWDSGNKAMRWLPGLYQPTTEIVDRKRWEIGEPVSRPKDTEGRSP